MALKVAKARTSDHEVENDLRGLGHTSLLGDMTPEPILTVDGDWKLLSHIATELKIEVHADLSARESKTHLHVNDSRLGHKEKAIQLFAFSLLLYSQRFIPSILWEHSRLRAELHHAIHEKHAMVDSPSMSDTVSLAPAIQLHLRQAGFSLAATDDVVHLNVQETQKLLSSFSTKRSIQLARAA